MSIWGTGSFMFTGTGSPDSTARTLNHSRLSPEFQQPDLIELTNPLTGEKYYNLRGNYATFIVEELVFKETTPATFATMIFSYIGKDVTNVKPYGSVIMDITGGTAAIFTVVSAKPYPFAELDDRQKIIIEFRSKKYIDLAASLA
jgi:hypothetical protein